MKKSITTKLIVAITGILLYACHTSQSTFEPPTRNDSFTISDKLDEISGLQIVGDGFYGFNDSGGKPKLYKVEKQGAITQTLRLQGAKNIDWEAMAMNDSLIFVADFGNNRGNRKDLCIYYVRRKDIKTNQKVQEIATQKLSFYYPQQTDFSNQNRAHNFDCEALLWFNDKLHLFTKEWKSSQTHHYTLELTETRQAAQLVESYDTRFLVTGADVLKVNEKTSFVALIGYTKLGYVHLLNATVANNQDKFLSSPKQRKLGHSSKLGQVEGISIASPNVIYYSAEAYKNVPQHITRLELKY